MSFVFSRPGAPSSCCLQVTSEFLGMQVGVKSGLRCHDLQKSYSCFRPSGFALVSRHLSRDIGAFGCAVIEKRHAVGSRGLTKRISSVSWILGSPDALPSTMFTPYTYTSTQPSVGTSSCTYFQICAGFEGQHVAFHSRGDARLLLQQLLKWQLLPRLLQRRQPRSY